ncbi:ubiquitin-protein ligase domain-containing protein [Planoprotostelium fungivorum]|uniref:HECT-type E3 ubiquitin transferase n=1 Tax=Planoprotostelium fungivorum TaxID=1890364 RepID=A0A2P6NZW0_9EUKA|nr:ubiquitin-protein ligase domain-containing protein [Planoprotostelium fungivorum]
MEFDANAEESSTQAMSHSSQDLFSSQNPMSNVSDIRNSTNPFAGRGRLNTLLQGLKSEGNEGMQLQCLLELCDFLSMGTEENMANVSMDSFVPVLIQLLNVEYNPEIMLISCRALAYLMEALPSSCQSIVNHKGVEPLCAKLLSIEFIDLAEQAIQCLEKISIEYPTAVLQSGGLMAVLSYIDFFAINTQRICVSIAANLCRQVPNECYPMVEDSFLNLENLLDSSDTKIVEKTVVCFARLTEMFLGSEDKLLSMCRNQLIHKLCKLVTPQNASTATPTSANNHNSTIDDSSLLCTVPHLWKRVVSEGLIEVLSQWISSCQSGSSSTTPSSLLPIDQLIQVLSLINELFPSLPQDMRLLLPQASTTNDRRQHLMRIPQRIIERLNAARISLRDSEGILSHLESRLTGPPVGNKREEQGKKEEREERAEKEGNKEEEEDESEEREEEEEDLHRMDTDEDILALLGNSQLLLETQPAVASASTARSSEKESMLVGDPELLKSFGSLLAGPLIQVLTSAVNPIVRSKSLAALSKIVILSSESTLYAVLQDLSVSSFLANLLANSELSIVAACLQIGHVLLVKMPNVFIHHFKREGLVFELEKLISKYKDAPRPEHLTLKDSSDSTYHLFTAPASTSVEELEGTLLPPWIGHYAALIHNLYFLGKEEDKTPQYVGLCDIAEQLRGRARVNGRENVEGNEGISTFELLESNILTSLYSYLTLSAPKPSEGETMKGEESLNKSGEMKLHDIINKLENFTVAANEISGTASGLKLLAHPFKLKLVKSEEEIDPMVQNYATGNVLAEPLSVVSSVENYVSNKIYADIARTGKESLPSAPRIQLSLNGSPLHPWETVLKSIEREERKGQKNKNDTQMLSVHKMWEKSWTIEYKLSTEDKMTLGQEEQKEDSFEDIFQGERTLGQAMNLMKILYHCCFYYKEFEGMKEQGNEITLNEFCSTKLSAKLSRQLKDPFVLLSNSYPDWVCYMLRMFPFLFTCESRVHFFSTTSFGVARALHHMYNHPIHPSDSHSTFRVGRIPRQKVRVSRSKILPSAMKSKSILEVEYFGEVGTGLGPTLEFFTLVCREIQKSKHSLWRSESCMNTTEGMVLNYGGLYPSPIDPSLNDDTITKKLSKFEFLGTFVAKGILDSRILDLQMSDAMLKSMLNLPLHFVDLKALDPSFSQSVEKLMNLHLQYKAIVSTAQREDEKKKDIEGLKLGDVNMEDLSLDFTVIGMPESGKDVEVTLHNLEEYIHLTVDFHLQRGVKRQMEAFKRGFNSVMDMEELSSFSITELNQVYFGAQDASWDMQSSPKLPAGGFSSLQPKLTIVRKEPEGENPDIYLPSVNCCFYYLKLPEYSNPKILKEKLLFAIQHGQGAFSFN